MSYVVSIIAGIIGALVGLKSLGPAWRGQLGKHLIVLAPALANMGGLAIFIIFNSVLPALALLLFGLILQVIIFLYGGESVNRYEIAFFLIGSTVLMFSIANVGFFYYMDRILNLLGEQQSLIRKMVDHP